MQAKRRKKRKKRSWFFSAVCFMLLFCIPLGAGSLRELWSFLEEYQISLPENTAQEGLELFQNRDIGTLSQFVDYTPHPLDRSGSLDGWLAEYLGFDDESAEYTLIPKTGGSNQKRYVVARDGFQVAELLLAPSGVETKRGFSLWELNDIDIASVAGNYGMEIVVPQGVEVTVNGFPLDESYLIDNAVPLEISGYQDLGQGYQPIALKYRVEGLLEPPEVEANPKDSGYCSLEDVSPESGGNINYYQAKRFAGQDFIDTAGIKAEFAAKLYARFITKDATFDSLLPYLLKDGPLYKQLYGFSNSWYIDHDSYDFQDFEMDNFVLYDESHYSCDVRFCYVIRMGAKVYEYPSAYTLYFVYGAGDWLLASLEIQ